MKQLLAILLLLAVLPGAGLAQELPDSAQESLDSPPITAEEFQAASAPQLLGQLLDKWDVEVPQVKCQH